MSCPICNKPIREDEEEITLYTVEKSREQERGASKKFHLKCFMRNYSTI